jgi:DNA-binding MarR family transcriptional regulator
MPQNIVSSDVSISSGPFPSAAEESIDAFASLVGLMNRFLTRLAGVQAFKRANLGLSEWLALLSIRSSEGLSNKQLAQALGITVQRAAQISEALRTAGLITAVQSTKDSRKNVMATTEHGRAELISLNEGLLSLIVDVLKDKPQVLHRTRRGVRALMPMVAPPQTSRSDRAPVKRII